MLTALALYRQVQNTRIWYFVKALFLLFFGAFAAFGPLEVMSLMSIFAILLVAFGAAGLIINLINSFDDSRYSAFGVISNLLQIVAGVLFLIWPLLFGELWLIIFVMSLMLDGLYVTTALLSVRAMGASKWWSIIGGAAVFLGGLLVIGQVMNWSWKGLVAYCFLSAVFYFVTVAVINPKNILVSSTKKAVRQVKKALK